MIQAVKNILMSAWYYLFSRDYRTVRNSIYFDSDYYRRMNSDVATTGGYPLLHYVTRGFAELRQPGPLFDSQYYVKQVPAIKENAQDPLVHFLRDGWRAGKKANFLFDPLWYIQENPDVDFTQDNPLSHFLQSLGDGSAPPYFDAIYYKNKYKDAAASAKHPLVHYLWVGLQENRRPSLYFDTAWYIDKTPVLRESGMDSLTHYFNFGIKENKSPSPLFDPIYYAQTYNITGSEDLFAHYIKYGASADHRPCSWFDPDFYRQHYLKPDNDSTPPLEHYLAQGVQDGLYPNRDVFKLPNKPVISLLVPVYNVSLPLLNNCIRSVLYQSYPHWELCLADDCSTMEEIRPLLEYWAGRDSRIKVVFLGENRGISGATNAAAELVTGSYLGFLDNDDELVSDCLFTVAQKINTENADLYYSDEDLIGEDGRQFCVFNKPDFNKELLLGHNYITHFVVTERLLYESVGGFDSEMDGAQDFDLFLKLSEQAKKIVHIPEVLYHWRASESSTSINHNQKQYADEAGRKAVQNAMERQGIPAAVEFTDWKFFYRVKKELTDSPLVSVIIPYREDDGFQEWFAELISCTVYPEVEFFILSDNRQQGLVTEQIDLDAGPKIQFISACSGTSSAACFNEAARQSSGEYLVFLNPQVQLQNKDWIEAMLEYAMDNNVGIVGGRILPFGNDEFVTTVPDLSQQSDSYYARFIQEGSRHMNGLQCVQEVLALSWDLSMVERELFLESGGYDEKFLYHFFVDSDLCFRLRNNGQENIYTPFALGQWLVSKEKQLDSPQSSARQDKMLFQKRWNDVLSSGDPFYNYGVLERDGISRDDFFKWFVGEQDE